LDGPISLVDAERRLAELSRRAATAPEAPARRSPTRKPTVIFGNMMGIAGGGFLGIVAGYWLLNYFGGPQFDFLQLPLPLVAHTQPGGAPKQEGGATMPPPFALARGEEDADWALGPVTREEAPEVLAETIDPHVIPASAAEALVEPADHMPVDDTAATPEPANGSATSGSKAGNPVYSSDELRQALEAADSVLGCAACDSTGAVTRVVVSGVREVNGQSVEQTTERQFVCEACRGRPTTRITQEVYRRLCRLSEAATYVAVEPDDVSAWQQRDAIARVLLKAGGDRARLEGIGRLAGYWLANRDTDTRGILVAGTVREIEQQGDYFYTRVVLFGLPKEVTVVSTIRAPLERQDRVLIAGAVVDHPATSLPGFEGNQPVVVWGGLPVRLAD
jgi:hypothetical protein